MNEALIPRRLAALSVVAIALLGALIARLWFLQVMQAPEFEQLAAGNRTREIITEAPRGLIYDTNGRVLAGRRESRVVTLDWTQLRDFSRDERADIFAEAAEEMNRAGEKVKAEDLERRFDAARNGSLKPVPLAEDVSTGLWLSLEERALPGFAVEQRWVRVYPYGEVGGNIVGYTGNVGDSATSDDLNAKNDGKIYQPGDELGRAGIEALFESVLRGVPEIRTVEIDAQNRVIGTVAVLQEAVPGSDVYLAIDIDMQYAAEQILEDELRLARQREACEGCLAHVGDAGSLVAVDSRDGTVMALATYPRYDPSDFIFGMSPTQYQSLLDRPDTPLLDRSIKGLYPAGSTFKHVTAYASLTSGARSAVAGWNDEGVYTLPNCTSAEASGCQWRNAGGASYGNVSLYDAIEKSSDTYFYSLGAEFWVQQETYGRTIMQDTALRFGFGTATGIQLPEERSGRVPTPENRKEEFGEDRQWYTGDNVNLSIGQGDLLVTPLQLADSYAVLANGGTRYQPRLVDRVVDPVTGATVTDYQPRVVADEDLDPTAIADITAGLVRVTGGQNGTATGAFAGFPLGQYSIAGKTGTAEVAKKADYSLFAGFGPADNPRYAVAAVLEQSGFGGAAAAPAARRLFELLGGFAPLPAAPTAGEPAVGFPRDPLIAASTADGFVDADIAAIAAAAQEADPGDADVPAKPGVAPGPSTTAPAAPSTEPPAAQAPPSTDPTPPETAPTTPEPDPITGGDG